MRNGIDTIIVIFAHYQSPNSYAVGSFPLLDFLPPQRVHARVPMVSFIVEQLLIKCRRRGWHADGDDVIRHRHWRQQRRLFYYYRLLACVAVVTRVNAFVLLQTNPRTQHVRVVCALIALRHKHDDAEKGGQFGAQETDLRTFLFDMIAMNNANNFPNSNGQQPQKKRKP